METIKERLQKDYNDAVLYYNKKDYVGFFRNLRPAIELLSKLIIYDLLGEDDATDLIDGEKDIDQDHFRLIDYPQSHKPTGKDFISLSKKVLYMKSHLKKSDGNQFRYTIDNYISNLMACYTTASSIGMHTDKSNQSSSILAKSKVCFLMEFFDFIKNERILSDSTISFLFSLNPFMLEDQTALEESKREIESLQNKLEAQAEVINAANRKKEEVEQQLSEMQIAQQAAIASKNREIESVKSKHKMDVEAKNTEISRLNEAYNKEKEDKNAAERLALEANAKLSQKDLLLQQRESEKVELEKRANKVLKERDEALMNAAREKAEGQKKIAQAKADMNNALAKAKQAEFDKQEAIAKAEAARIQVERQTPVRRFEPNDPDFIDVLRECGDRDVPKRPTRIIRITNTEDEADVQETFKGFVESHFLFERRRCFTRIDSNPNNYEPEFVVELKARGETETFAVAIFYQKKASRTFTLSWEYLSKYRKFNTKIDGSFYFVLAVGGVPEFPKAMYLLPLQLFKKDTPVRLTTDYKVTDMDGSFRYDIPTSTLTFE